MQFYPELRLLLEKHLVSRNKLSSFEFKMKNYGLPKYSENQLTN